jgi:predicted transposase YbfD/YdcC
VLGQETVFEKSNEITAIPALIERLDLVGALVSIDAMGCRVAIAQSILDAGAGYLLAVKDNQPTLHAEIKSYFATAAAAEVEKAETIGKDHGRFELRNYSVSHQVDWYAAERSYPGAPRFPQLTTIAMVESRIERGGTIQTERRSCISSHTLLAAAFAADLAHSDPRRLGSRALQRRGQDARSRLSTTIRAAQGECRPPNSHLPCRKAKNTRIYAPFGNP